MYTVMTAKTPTQRRNAVNLSNASGNVRRSLAFKDEGLNGPIESELNKGGLVSAIKEALETNRVKRVSIAIVDTDIGTAVWVSPLNMDQSYKVDFVMDYIGFKTPNGFHWYLLDDMKKEGFSL